MEPSTDYSKLISAVAGIITAIIAIINFRSARRRVKLKDDLEILKRVKEGFSEDYSRQKDICDYMEYKIHKRLKKTYVNKGIDRSDSFTAFLFLLFAILPWFLPHDGVFYQWRALFTILFGGLTVWFINSALKGRDLERPAPPKNLADKEISG
jgi:hypothetical protein